MARQHEFAARRPRGVQLDVPKSCVCAHPNNLALGGTVIQRHELIIVSRLLGLTAATLVAISIAAKAASTLASGMAIAAAVLLVIAMGIAIARIS